MDILGIVLSFMEAAAIVSGAGQVENLTEDEIEKYRDFADNTLKINMADAAELDGSGLFSTFRTASLLDYIRRNGPVLSVNELASIDGFDIQMAEALSYFVSFETEADNGGGRWTGKAELQGGANIRLKETGTADATLRAETAKGRNFYMNIAAAGACGFGSRVASKEGDGAGDGDEDGDTHGGRNAEYSMDAFTLSCIYFPKPGLRLVAGDFNARFGQGLAYWNTMTINSSTSTASLILRPSGLSASHSLKGNYAETGLGLSATFGRFRLSGTFSLPGIKTVLLSRINGSGKNVAGMQGSLNLNYWGRYVTAGVTSVVQGKAEKTGMKTTGTVAADFRSCIRGADIAGEAAVSIKCCPATGENINVQNGNSLREEGGDGHKACRTAVDGIYARLAATVPAGEYVKTGILLNYSPKEHMAKAIAEAGTHRHHFAIGTTLSHKTPSTGSRKTDFLNCRADADAVFNWKDRWQWRIRLKENIGLRKNQAYGGAKANGTDTTGPATDEPGTTDPATNGLATTCVHSGRTDLSLKYCGGWQTGITAAVSKSSRWGLAAYVEQSFRSEGRCTAHLRAGIFSVDDWDGRIYFYEHDIRGRFTVPALYGRGFWLSGFVSAKLGRKWSVSARLSWKDYVFMRADLRKPTAIEARIALVSKF